ncbi:prolyl hydroxylase family protein [Spartinivicinus ruber]|uniref:prolyl hydroxylase family protein n=1 Tax=Spartinivicinus ruber TaxID=2683272 RepID=UPI001CA3DFE4|nr:2OG-Fe(II) oxygenase [Spartinivicinus ruber]
MLIEYVSDSVWTINHFILNDQCTKLIEQAENIGFDEATVRTHNGYKSMPFVRNNERVFLNDPELAQQFWQKLAQVELPVLDGCTAQCLSRQFRFYKYTPGQRFKMHKDGRLKEDGLESRLSFLIYLNDGYQGGDTLFRGFSVKPETGKALMFVHETWHEGERLTEGTKYVLRTDVMYLV